MSAQQKSPIANLSDAEWATLSTKVQTVVIGLVDENRQLKLTVSKLEEQLRRNSRKSSPPRSQDKAEQKPIQEEKASPPRRRGGQAGHVGRGRALVPVDSVVLWLCIDRCSARCVAPCYWGMMPPHIGIK